MKLDTENTNVKDDYMDMLLKDKDTLEVIILALSQCKIDPEQQTIKAFNIPVAAKWRK